MSAVEGDRTQRYNGPSAPVPSQGARRATRRSRHPGGADRRPVRGVRARAPRCERRARDRTRTRPASADDGGGVSRSARCLGVPRSASKRSSASLLSPAACADVCTQLDWSRDAWRRLDSSDRRTNRGRSDAMCQFCVSTETANAGTSRRRTTPQTSTSDLARRDYIIEFLSDFDRKRAVAIGGMEILGMLPGPVERAGKRVLQSPDAEGPLRATCPHRGMRRDLRHRHEHREDPLRVPHIRRAQRLRLSASS